MPPSEQKWSTTLARSRLDAASHVYRSDAGSFRKDVPVLQQGKQWIPSDQAEYEIILEYLNALDLDLDQILSGHKALTPDSYHDLMLRMDMAHSLMDQFLKRFAGRRGVFIKMGMTAGGGTLLPNGTLIGGGSGGTGSIHGLGGFGGPGGGLPNLPGGHGGGGNYGNGFFGTGFLNWGIQSGHGGGGRPGGGGGITGKHNTGGGTTGGSGLDWTTRGDARGSGSDRDRGGGGGGVDKGSETATGGGGHHLGDGGGSPTTPGGEGPAGGSGSDSDDLPSYIDRDVGGRHHGPKTIDSPIDGGGGDTGGNASDSRRTFTGFHPRNTGQSGGVSIGGRFQHLAGSPVSYITALSDVGSRSGITDGFGGTNPNVILYTPDPEASGGSTGPHNPYLFPSDDTSSPRGPSARVADAGVPSAGVRTRLR